MFKMFLIKELILYCIICSTCVISNVCAVTAVRIKPNKTRVESDQPDIRFLVEIISWSKYFRVEKNFWSKIFKG